MRDFRDAKAMAQTLREALKQKSVPVTHSESLELIAKILGVHDWNELSAKIQSDIQSAHNPKRIRITTADHGPPVPLPDGADMPVVPIRDIVMFPSMIAPLFIGREKTRRAIEYAMAADKCVLAVTQRRAGDDDPTQEGLFGVGVIASVIDFMPLPDGTLRVITRNLKRVTLARCIAGEMLAAKVAPFAESRGDVAQAGTLIRTVLERLRAYLDTHPRARCARRCDRAADADRDRPATGAARDWRCDGAAREDSRVDEERPAGGVGRRHSGARVCARTRNPGDGARWRDRLDSGFTAARCAGMTNSVTPPCAQR
jgi:uncharacterized protein